MSSPLLSHATIHGFLRHVLRLAIPVSVTLTIYLYLYPFFLTCGFPLPAANPQDGHLGAWFETIKLHLPGTQLSSPSDARPPPAFRVAPFRLLAMGDPQIEGDTSIPNYYATTSFPHLHSFLHRLISRSDDYPSFHASTKQAFHDLVDFYFDDIPATLESIRKSIDLFGNDFYLAHMFRAVHWWTVPTHVAVLGDLVGSQWISDAEFDRRAQRYWRRAFKGGERVPDDLAAWPADTYDPSGELGTRLYDEAWRKRILNVAGNHDIGYAGDLTIERMQRFEREFGKVNYELRFELPPSILSPEGAASIRNETTDPDHESSAHQNDRLVPELRIVLLNSMNLDTPVATTELQDQTYTFINDVINTATAVEYKGHFTVVLTHVPLYKPEGICVDAPFFSFHEDGTLKEQNQLSADASRGFVEGIFGLNGDASAAGAGMGRRGVLLNGHDHEGCDTWHFINQSEPAKPSETPQNSDIADEKSDELEPLRDGDEPRMPETTQESVGTEEYKQFNNPDSADGDEPEKSLMPQDSDIADKSERSDYPVDGEVSETSDIQQEPDDANETGKSNRSINNNEEPENFFAPQDLNISDISGNDTKQDGGYDLKKPETHQVPSTADGSERNNHPDDGEEFERADKQEDAIDTNEFGRCNHSIDSTELEKLSISQDSKMADGPEKLNYPDDGDKSIKPDTPQESDGPNLREKAEQFDDEDEPEKPDTPSESDLFVDLAHDEDSTVPSRTWQARSWHNATSEGIVGAPLLPGVREITVRSMMGGYGGNAGLLSAWFDEETWEWQFEYATCALGTQHLWWAVHITDLIVAVLVVVYGVMSVWPRQEVKSVKEGPKKGKENGVTHGVSHTKLNGSANGSHLKES